MADSNIYRSTIQSGGESKTQRARILRLLIDARGQWVPLPQILELRISQFGARILELRRAGFHIENRTEQIDGTRHSWYRIVSSPTPPAPAPKPEPAPTPEPEWKDRPRSTGLPLFDLAARQ